MNNIDVIEQEYQLIIASDYSHFRELNDQEKEIMKKDGTLNKWFYNLLISYGKQCDHITEVGIGGGSSGRAWLYCRPKKLVGIDIRRINKIQKIAEQVGIEYDLIIENSIKIEIEETDLLFLDGNHSSPHVFKELTTHSPKVKKYIIADDIGSEGRRGPTGYGVNAAFIQFLGKNKKWELVERVYVASGLIIIKRVEKE